MPGKEAFAKENPQITNALESAKVAVEYTKHVADTLRGADDALAKDRSAGDTLSKEIQDAMEALPEDPPDDPEAEPPMAMAYQARTLTLTLTLALAPHPLPGTARACAPSVCCSRRPWPSTWASTRCGVTPTLT